VIDHGIVDANVFLRHLTREPVHQAEASTAFLRSLADEERSAVLLPTAVLEVVFILERQYGADREAVYAALQEILQISGLFVQYRAQLLDASEVYRNRRSVSFADAYHCAMARDFHGGGIVSFDRKLNGVPGVTRTEPDAV
jgi:predicted nucleic-acid-binding protein